MRTIRENAVYLNWTILLSFVFLLYSTDIIHIINTIESLLCARHCKADMVPAFMEIIV